MRTCLLGLLVWGCGAFPGLSLADDQTLAQQLRTLDINVATADEAAAWRNAVPDELQRMEAAANAASTRDWRAISNRGDWEQFRDVRLTRLAESLGTWPPPQTTPAMHVTRTLEGAGFTINNLLYESRPGWWVSANLYRPDPPRDSQPGLIICASHHTSKTQGELQDMGMTWARAGCLVLIPDQVGHGERRQHPFASAADYPQPFRVGHADYYFRYDSGLQLQLLGESLCGWIAWDLVRGIDVLLAQPGIDPQRLALLGAVAGGGDPAAVAAALDQRLTAAVLFNFGGPQPESRYPLPDDAETSFNYLGGGSWESTRNLRRSGGDGFLPWVIVGSLAPRGLVYAHEFRWDQERDPVWKRLQAIYGFYDQPGQLAFTLGQGSVKGQTAEDTHCTHIGPVQRVLIHEAFQRWLQIDVDPSREYSQRRPSADLLCWTDAWKQRLQPKSLCTVLQTMADAKLDQARKQRATLAKDGQGLVPDGLWEMLLGEYEPEREGDLLQVDVSQVGDIVVDRWTLTPLSGPVVPFVMLTHSEVSRPAAPLVVAVCSQGKSRLLAERADDVARLLAAGAVVCLIDPRGIGETRLGDSHGRRSAATAYASSRLMHSGNLLGDQIRDVRTIMKWREVQPDLQNRPIVLWGESRVPANPAEAKFLQPRDDDSQLPAPSEPQGPLIVLFTALLEPDVTRVYTHGGLASWKSLLAEPLVLTSYDSLIPGVLSQLEITDLLGLIKDSQIRLEATVDGWNRLAPLPAGTGPHVSHSPLQTDAARWMLEP